MRKSHSSEFKLEAASMVLGERQSVPDVYASLDIGPTALRRCVDQIRLERLGSILEGANAITADQREIHHLNALLKQNTWILKS